MESHRDDCLRLVRAEVRALPTPVAEPFNQEQLYLDGNTLAGDSPGDISGLNRPDPASSMRLRVVLATRYGVDAANILPLPAVSLAFDLLIRCFCTPFHNRFLYHAPSMTPFSALGTVNGTRGVASKVDVDFGFSEGLFLSRWERRIPLLFVATPCDPSGHLVDKQKLLALANDLEGHAMVVIDERYLEFSGAESVAGALSLHPNLIVIRSPGPAYGLNALDVGVVIAAEPLIKVLTSMLSGLQVAPPLVRIIGDALADQQQAHYQKLWSTIRDEVRRLHDSLGQLSVVDRIWPSKANFLMMRLSGRSRIVDILSEKGIHLKVLDESDDLLGCVRVTVGNPVQNGRLIEAMAEI